MSRRILISAIFAAALLLAGPGVSAQTPFRSAMRENLWNLGDNPAGIRMDTSVMRVSYAEFHSGLKSGGFHATNQAKTNWNIGAKAESLVHLDRFSMKGAFSFDEDFGKDMCGSVFINPDYYPVDILEFTPGRKNRQTYAFDGAISVDVTDQIMVGGKIDFSSANYAKRKDLRHTNYRLDFSFAPGFIYWRPGLAIGLHYIFKKTSEAPEAEQIGTGESSYYAFLDKGLMYGKYEVWTGSGLHIDESGVSGFPVKECHNGAGFQISWDDLNNHALFIEAEYLYGKGTVGEKQFVWYRFPSNTLNVGMGFKLGSRGSQHVVSAKAHLDEMKLDETVLDKVTEGGVVLVREYGENQIQARSSKNFNVKYTYIADRWEIGGEMNTEAIRTKASQMYPYTVEQRRHYTTLGANTVFHYRKMDIFANFGFGWGSAKEDSETVDELSGVTSELFRLQDWYEKDLEYKTATRIIAGAGARYFFWKRMYAGADIDIVGASGVDFLPGASRFGVTLRLGYEF